MMKKFNYLFFLFLFAVNCGYQPIYTNQKSLNFKLKEVILIGDKKINQKILNFTNLKKNSSDNNALEISIETSQIRNISSKDNSGNPLTYQMSLSSTLIVKINNNLIDQTTFTSSFSYSNKENKFDLREYEKNILEDLIRSNSEKITTYLSLRK
tara:strand:- start:1851 stop:2312 length:462 start_codon:yes stop_codon:yes gene_type:complete